jgi:hypothetical protein
LKKASIFDGKHAVLVSTPEYEVGRCRHVSIHVDLLCTNGAPYQQGDKSNRSYPETGDESAQKLHLTILNPLQPSVHKIKPSGLRPYDNIDSNPKQLLTTHLDENSNPLAPDF